MRLPVFIVLHSSLDFEKRRNFDFVTLPICG